MKTPLQQALTLDAQQAVDSIVSWLRQVTLEKLRRRGAVLGLSGGIDSSVTAALCTEAFGRKRVLGLLMPEADSADESRQLGQLLADHLGIETVTEELTPLLTVLRCYERRDAAFRKVIPEYGPDWKAKIVLPSVLDSDSYRLFSVVAQAPDGTVVRKRLTAAAYLEVVAATNFKQRTRKMLEYFHADRLNHAVAGTPNLPEFDQGFFVKLGDGAADVKPIAHLYKTQVYQLAGHFGLPEIIRSRPPTTDTYSLPQTQEEFYFSLPYDQMDVCLYAVNHGVPAEAVAQELALETAQVERVFADIHAKRRAAAYLHAWPQLHEEVRAGSTLTFSVPAAERV
jgi:NAD+ synthase